ncbi:NAD(P)-binding protein [Aspergillus welwitschiae]|uniref:NAD(P)-binding protein n=1 Tax=Aspergillus welwitschiae TaxID=1341132 RepID=A0A3F3PQ28_9EURO|nr:NAD(P)-binding protein [Aspergillus welwitschiae]RDH28862.1 NAD(P)-binding protein [Aspergillus welwitschiae]
MSKVLVVVGATGQQGSSIINSILSDPKLSQEYTIRGTTRDPNSPKAQALAAKGIAIVAANFNEPESLQRAFTGAHTVFANTPTIYDGHTYEHEVAHGRALIDAAVAVGVPFYIYSTLPSISKISQGWLKNGGHFDGKEEVEQYIRTQPIRSAFVAPGSFMSNFHDTMAPRRMENGDYALLLPVPAHIRLPLIETEADLGKWVAAILADFDQYEGKVLCCATALYSFEEIVETMSRVSGKTVTYREVPVEIWATYLPELMRGYIVDMFTLFRVYGYYGDGTEEKVKWSAEQARGDLTTLEEYLRKYPLNLE